MDESTSDATYFVPPIDSNFWELNSMGFSEYEKKTMK